MELLFSIPLGTALKGKNLLTLGWVHYRAFFKQFWVKAPCQNWEKMIEFTSKLGEINDIGHNKGSKIYPQNQVILDCIMPSIPLKHK